MKELNSVILKYLEFCQYQKKLDEKTIKAYKTDLTQFSSNILNCDVSEIDNDILEDFIRNLHKKFKPKTVKRKIASLLLTQYFPRLSKKLILYNRLGI